MTRRGAAVVSATLALAAGCGGEDEARDDYERTVAVAYATIGTRIDTVEAAATSLDQTADRAIALGAELERAAEDLGGVEPPEDAERAHAELLPELRTWARHVVRQVVAVSALPDRRGLDSRSEASAPLAQELEERIFAAPSVRRIERLFGEIAGPGTRSASSRIRIARARAARRRCSRRSRAAR